MQTKKEVIILDREIDNYHLYEYIIDVFYYFKVFSNFKSYKYMHKVTSLMLKQSIYFFFVLDKKDIYNDSEDIRCCKFKRNFLILMNKTWKLLKYIHILTKFDSILFLNLIDFLFYFWGFFHKGKWFFNIFSTTYQIFQIKKLVNLDFFDMNAMKYVYEQTVHFQQDKASCIQKMALDRFWQRVRRRQSRKRKW